ncbi:MAG: DUF86 domain-containing protein [Deltaproteobacteria bacterium]|nr:DUF86 domain-containing protein [Deltaproteobacteria bacterium]
MPKNNFLEADLNRVRHMLDATQEILSFVQNKSRDDFHSDRMLLLSVIKELEIIGEAANKVSDSFRAKHKHIPWEQMVGIRNRLIHAYFDIDVDIVWNTISQHLEKLSAFLEKILSK